MRPVPALVLSVVLFASAAAAAPAKPPASPPAADWTQWSDFHRDFTNWPLDSSRIARVASLMIERDAGTFVLQEGQLAFAAPFGGRTVAAVFTGRGTFSFVPRSEIERQQLRRFYGTTSLRVPISQLVLFFSDSTARELSSGLAFAPDTAKALQQAWRAAFPYLTWRRTTYVRPLELAQMLLDHEDNGLFRALVNPGRGGDPVFFTLDPTSAERVRLERRPEDDRVGMRRLFNAETVSQFFALGDPDSLRRDRLPPYSAVAYRADVTLDDNPRLRAAVEVDVRASGHARGWLAFVLPDWLTIDSLVVPGRRVTFAQEKDNDVVWTRVEPPLAAGETATFRFAYHGEAFVRRDDWIWHRDLYGWAPRPAWAGEATWDLWFTYPRDLQLVAAGRRQEWLVIHKLARSHWLVERPMDVVSFDVNFLRAIRVERDSLPVTVWSRHLDGAGRVTVRTPESLRGEKGGDEAVAYDVANCLEFYGRMFGEPVAQEFHALETPENTYVAYPGMIHMMRLEDRIPGRADFSPHVVRAHEIAHQWFGLGLDNATYHDAWLSEGFANFCSIWYRQAACRDAKTYLDVLGKWREDLLENRKFLVGVQQEAGPVWLGWRTNSSSTPGDYALVVYRKGAWVLHMLRNMMLDENDPSESAFRELMRGWYARFRGGKAFTEDFRAEVERATGQDMGWFFDQWIYGTAVPTYRFSWTSEPAGNGQWRVKCRVVQTNVPDTFRMPVFVRVDFGRDGWARRRVWITGPVTEFELPLAPRQPTNVKFSDLESVLCEVVE
ncbi:MAG: M1 family aminopeptidase [Candidatus Eisenbacteria bacterium]